MRRSWVYALDVKGRFQRIHRWSGLLLQGLLFGVPWLTVGGHPAVRIDLPARRVYALGAIFTPQDAVYLVLIWLMATFSLFLFTALYGRLWCGYGCPQTVFLEEWIRPLETLIEGSRGVRMARDRKGWTWRKGVKWAAFAGVAIVVTLTCMSWFTGARALWTGQAGGTAYAISAVLATGLFLDFAWFREQFCTYLCPYARFQGALTDPQSLVVAYQVGLGEPRRGSGACIDCGKCAAVCPQGIDIRDGYQLECITCGRCIDACDEVLGKRGQPGLIRYTPLVAPASGTRALIRPRTVAYGALLFGLAAAFVATLASHHALSANVSRAPGTLYVIDPDGWTRNTYLLQVTNQGGEDRDYTVSVEGLPAGAEQLAAPIALASSRSATVPLIVRIPPGGVAERTLPLTITVSDGDDAVSLAATFKGTGGGG